MQLIPSDDPRLLQVCEPYTLGEIKSPETKAFVSDLYKVMKDNNGIGIAAPQVGVLKQVIIMFDQVMFNPKIIKQRGSVEFNEGCLSFPGKFIKVKRSATISVKSIDINGKLLYQELTGLEARVFLHEAEHLKGIVFTTYENK
jgi:peptide deformylase